MKYEYVTCCVHSTANKIHAMVDRAREITYETFRKYVDISSINEHFGYESTSKQGLTLKKDWAVRYFRSVYDGRTCVYMAHSAIEYIYSPA